MPDNDKFLSLDGRIAIVTGAAQGIGQAIAQRLASAGACVVIADVNGAGATAVARSFEELGLKANAFTADITKRADVAKLIQQVLDRFGQIDVLVNNAGRTGPAVPLWELSDDDWESVLRLDLTGVFYCCREVIGHMRGRRSGCIVNIASIAGKEGNPNFIPYSTAKAGVIGLTKALAKEVIMDGIRVNCVAPALIDTPLLATVAPEQIAALRSKIPMGRLGRAEEVAAVVHFLVSDDASFVTGQCYDVSGGRATY